jgi:DNA primase
VNQSPDCKWNLPKPELQVPFNDADGLIGYVDFLWRRRGKRPLVGEFDGRVKYRLGGLTSQTDIERTLWEEKRREDRLRKQADVVRWTWTSAIDASRLGRELAAYGKGEFGEPVVLDVDGLRRQALQPRSCLLRRARRDQARPRALLRVRRAPGIVNALRERPCMLHRFPDGVDGPKVHQKRLPRGAPPWVETVRLHFPRYGLHADELMRDQGRRCDLGGPDVHGRVPPVEQPAGRHREAGRVAHRPRPDARRSLRARPPRREVSHEVLDELGAVGYPKTSGGRGLHIYVRIVPEHGFGDVRRAALAFAREVERRLPDDVTTTWWRKDRDPAAVFVDYNQNARDHTIAAAYSVRGNPRGTVSAPLTWGEIATAEPDDFTIATMPARFAELGDLHAAIDDHALRHRTAAGSGRARRACGRAVATRGLSPRPTPNAQRPTREPNATADAIPCAGRNSYCVRHRLLRPFSQRPGGDSPHSGTVLELR